MKSAASVFIICSLFCFPRNGNGQNNPSTDSLLQLLEQAPTPRQRSKTLIALSKAMQGTDLNQSKQYAVRAMAELEPNDSLMVDALDQLARYFFYKAQLDSSLHYFKKAHYILSFLRDSSRIAAVNISIGSVLLQLSRYTEAVGAFIESAGYFESHHDSVNAAKCYNNLASALAELGELPRAIGYSQQALSIFQHRGMMDLVLITLPNLATQYQRQGQYEQALIYFDEAEKLAIQKNNKRSLTLIYTNLGDLFLSQGQLNKAKTYTEKSIVLKQELNQTTGLAKAYHNLGLIYSRTGDLKKAIHYYNEALKYADGWVSLGILQRLKEGFQATGDFPQALNYADQFQRLNDSLNKEKNLKEIEEVVTKYENTQQENEILKLRSNNQSLEYKHNRNQALLGGSVILLVILGFASYLLLNNARRKRIIDQQEHELEQQKMLQQIRNKELEAIDHIIQGQEDERTRIAADLHDSLGSKLASLKMYLDHLEDGLPARDPQQQNLEQIRQLTEDSYQEVRRIAHNFNSGVLFKNGLLVALKQMADFITKTNGIETKVISIDLNNRLENRVEIQLFRVIQELITNVIKHAKASEINIQLTKYEESLNIIVEDNGIGFDPQKVSNEGMGLNNLENRLIKLGAEYHIDSAPGNGTTIIINLPL